MMNKIKYYCIFCGMALIFFGASIFSFLYQSLANGKAIPLSAGHDSPELILSKLRTEDNPEWKVKWDKKKGIAKRLFHAKSKVFPGKPEDAARKFLSSYHGLFGLKPGLDDLRTKKSIKTPLGERITFRQHYNQIPVIGAEITVHVSDKNSIILVENQCIPDIQIDTQPLIEKDDALRTAERAVGIDESGVEKASSELVILPCGCEQNLVWRVIVSKKGLIDKTWLVYVDAKKKGWVLYKKKLQSSVTGTGTVYRENPITTPSLTTVTLNNLTNGSFLLEGDYGKPYNAECIYSEYDTSNLSKFSTAASSERNYSYTIGDNKLGEVMSYYHVNTMHDTLKSIGFDSLDAQIPVFVNAQDPDDSSLGYDNAFYTRDVNFPSTGYMLFGCGDELNNLGLDADVITHEYGHAVLDHIEPELYEVIEHNYSGAIHESTGDVMASYFGGNEATGSNETIGEWGLTSKDGTQDYTRNMNNKRRYPDDVLLPDYGYSEVHYTGEILNGVYWDIQKTLGSDTAFRVFSSAISLLPNDANFFDMRDAWVTADNALNNGTNVGTIEAAFAGRGIEGEDLGNEKAELKLNKITFYKYNPYTGTVKKQKTFQRGDYILIYLKANISDLTPAYNLIPKVSLIGSGSRTFDGESFYNEALEGLHEYLLAYVVSYSAKGKIRVKVKVRLGGTDKVKVKTATFRIK